MKQLAIYCALLLIATPAISQFYLRGEIKDEKNKPLPNARIFVHSARAFYYSGATSGDFGINDRFLYDSLTIVLEGYETLTVKVKTDQWQKIILKLTADAVSKNQSKLISFTKDKNQAAFRQWFAGDETYFQLVENEFEESTLFPATGFSLNVNKASYSNVRRFLNMNSLVPPDAIRTEELVNYFNLNYREPKGDSLFTVESQLTNCPWNNKEQLLYVNVSAKKLDLEKVPPGNFVFLIDVSGSMDMPNRLPLLKAAFQLFVKNLRPVDSVTIVTYGGYVTVWLTPTSGKDKEKILKSIEELEAQGDTPGESAIRVAYQTAKRSFIKGGNNRVILATDGDFNVGETSEKALDELISSQRQSGVYLTCLGVGMGNFKDSKLQILAKKGNGNYAYLDDIHEAERVLVKELTQTFYAVADDASLNLKFNPEYVKSYRLIGFDNKKEALADSLNNLEGGEMGSGSTVMAIFEIVPTEQNLKLSVLKSPIEIASMSLNYSQNQDSVIKKINFNAISILTPIDQINKELKFAAAVTMFALKLKNSKYYNDQPWSYIKNIAKSSADQSNYLQQQFLTLLDKASKLYNKRKRNKNEN
ncbi:MAG: von Willebrand factor type A domain-containing protein [Bacteroidota bacterium]